MQDTMVKHLELVQGIINRMSGNSFILKGWTVTSTAAILALIVSNPKPLFAAIALFSTLSFWGLDAYYLRQERLFRHLYDDVRGGLLTGTQQIEPFALSTARYQTKVQSWFQTLWSRSIIGLHGIVALVVVVTTLVLIALP